MRTEFPGGQIVSPFDTANKNRPKMDLTGLQISHLDHT